MQCINMCVYNIKRKTNNVLHHSPIITAYLANIHVLILLILLAYKERR